VRHKVIAVLLIFQSIHKQGQEHQDDYEFNTLYKCQKWQNTFALITKHGLKLVWA
jgi:hypothetical protein